MADYIYASGKPEEIHFDITGKRPLAEEVSQLTCIVFPKKRVSNSEIKSAIGDFFKWFGGGIAIFF